MFPGVLYLLLLACGLWNVVEAFKAGSGSDKHHWLRSVLIGWAGTLLLFLGSAILAPLRGVDVGAMIGLMIFQVVFGPIAWSAGALWRMLFRRNRPEELLTIDAPPDEASPYAPPGSEYTLPNEPPR